MSIEQPLPDDLFFDIGPFFGTAAALHESQKYKPPPPAVHQPTWKRWNVSQLIVSALIFLSVLAWVEFFFYDFRNPPADIPDIPDVPIPIPTLQKPTKKRERQQYHIISHLVPREEKRQRNLAFALIISIVATMFAIFFNIDWKTAFKNTRRNYL